MVGARLSFLIAMLLAVAPAGGILRADPVFSIAGTLPESGDYDTVLAALADVGAEATSLTLFWDDLEPAGRYDPDVDWPAIANAVYPEAGLALTLTISVVDTVADRRPEDLRALDWDDPRLIARFAAFLDRVLGRMPDVELLQISIGNEVDGVIGADRAEAYGRFFRAARQVARRHRPEVPVTITMTWPGLRSSAAMRDLADLGDAWSVTYYPIDADFAQAPPETLPAVPSQMRALAGDAPILLAEVGFSSDGCGATGEATQKRFFGTLFDTLAGRDDVSLVQLVWLHDIGAEEVAGYAGYYGQAAPCFSRYLSGLGLRHADGRDKLAFRWLREHAGQQE